MIVLKKINNNVAICEDSNHKELIAFGKGIGFPPTPYELTDLSKIDRTFYDVSNQYISLLNDIPYEIIQFTARQILEIQDELPYDTNSNLMLTLSDHIAFAIERVKKGIYIRMPSIYELEMNYPIEVNIGRKFISEILQEFKIKLPKSEAQGIAMHFINAQNYSLREEPAYVKQLEQHYEEILQQTVCIIEQEMGIQVRQDTFNYIRFATHIQYLLKRIYEQKYIDSNNLQMYKTLQFEFQEISDCVDKICDYYKNTWSLKVPDEEKLYLIIHINRVCSKNVQ
ncbi:PRD domain-containing protein [Anaerocolumna xylanovorans]|uniref:Transcriptional antiterminator, BglG family n=1 Tax=Anaerocolumna xylanovorans DSM 12503 TaxID=1121345 RepID=A0A1M7Y0S8_9FIRM|nr:PRD domain-containing protein [Anaerocolumna xylanovorans]SHO45286.1 transcriptional antiterminator, BglG family [Anaerocolumna xylanovorans DSM 12503]